MTVKGIKALHSTNKLNILYVRSLTIKVLNYGKHVQRF